MFCTKNLELNVFILGLITLSNNILAPQELHKNTMYYIFNCSAWPKSKPKGQGPGLGQSGTQKWVYKPTTTTNF
jgi:hypothetical protein